MLQAFTQAFIVTLREGLEAFLIVAISLAYLRKSGRRELVPAIHWAIGLSVGLSALVGLLLYRAANQEFWDGPLALLAAVSVAWLTIHMWRAGKRMKREIEGRLHESSLRPGRAAFLAVFLFTVLMVTREGMETALLLFQIKGSAQMVSGATAGITGAAAIAWMWSRYGHRVNLSLFFQVTAVFLFVFVIQLFVSGFHELAEQHLLPYSEVLHAKTEPYGPDGLYGHYLSYLLVLLPVGWLVFASVVHRNRSTQRTSAAA